MASPDDYYERRNPPYDYDRAGGERGAWRDDDRRDWRDQVDVRVPGGEPHRATVVFLFGLLSLIACAPLGIPAWVMGAADLRAMREGRMDRSGESSTNTGYVLGIIGTCVFGLGILFWILWAVAMTAILRR